ncbi:PH domain-containing protein [Candidatus Saccharibacteria bacterium]|nr:PH domain-containing protein [Candidatus Saccharibacteria bacterium]
MVTSHEVQRQLKTIGAEFRFWGKSELRELEHILIPGEHIMYCMNGRYEGGFAMLCITNQRIVLIDKKPFYLTLEDIRYDMVSEVDFNQRLIDATIQICTLNKKVWFTVFKAKLLRKATAYIQNRVMEFRQQHMMQPQQATSSLPYIQIPTEPATTAVSSFQHRITNPYTKMPLMMRRRVSRFYGDALN